MIKICVFAWKIVGVWKKISQMPPITIIFLEFCCIKIVLQIIFLILCLILMFFPPQIMNKKHEKLSLFRILSQTFNKSLTESHKKKQKTIEDS